MPLSIANRFAAPFIKLGLTAPNLEPLIQAYNDPSRCYHNIAHIISTLDLLATHGFSTPEAEIAVIYHDAVYDTHASDNELKSAEWARQDLISSKAPSHILSEIESAILATDHRSTITSELQARVADVDFAILGSIAATYKLYTKCIRQEYSWVAERDFISGRTKFIRHALSLPRLFHTTQCRNCYEELATQNLKTELQALEFRLCNFS